MKAQLGQRLRLSDEQRRRLAAKGKELGRKLLKEHGMVPEDGKMYAALDRSRATNSVLHRARCQGILNGTR